MDKIAEAIKELLEKRRKIDEALRTLQGLNGTPAEAPKTVIEAVIEHMRGVGVAQKVSQILEGITAQGIRIKANTLSSILQRAKEQGQLTQKRRGVWVLK